MNRLRSVGRRLRFVVVAAALWLAGPAAALAKAAKTAQEETKGGPTSWTFPYFLLLLGVGLGLLVVLRSARRREREKPEQYDESKQP